MKIPHESCNIPDHHHDHLTVFNGPIPIPSSSQFLPEEALSPSPTPPYLPSTYPSITQTPSPDSDRSSSPASLPTRPPTPSMAIHSIKTAAFGPEIAVKAQEPTVTPPLLDPSTKTTQPATNEIDPTDLPLPSSNSASRPPSPRPSPPLIDSQPDPASDSLVVLRPDLLSTTEANSRPNRSSVLPPLSLPLSTKTAVNTSLFSASAKDHTSLIIPTVHQPSNVIVIESCDPLSFSSTNTSPPHPNTPTYSTLIIHSIHDSHYHPGGFTTPDSTDTPAHSPVNTIIIVEDDSLPTSFLANPAATSATDNTSNLTPPLSSTSPTDPTATTPLLTTIPVSDSTLQPEPAMPNCSSDSFDIAAIGSITVMEDSTAFKDPQLWAPSLSQAALENYKD
ncbi:hypothetical protein PGT21_037013 [Puccinia graminis f. sp. tritici]|uniref:Uncharacterized protein n=1 Tax=Puccinia graminis f. sp. tritici TaxID=56615 RepID=A0A5B0QQT4_PUCGR|nr:hypothetical protein PGT21_037013 [Puccinia graminis f. sp. tritici]